jgi:hypothetical protein
MPNQKAMEELVKTGEAVDVSNCHRWMDKFYDVTSTFRGMDAEVDYCDVKAGAWVWSIGEHKVTRRLYASLDASFYDNPDFDCVWLR